MMVLEEIFGGFLLAEGLSGMFFSQDKRLLSQILRIVRMAGGAWLLAGGE